jgi:hypothetical protein
MPGKGGAVRGKCCQRGEVVANGTGRRAAQPLDRLVAGNRLLEAEREWLLKRLATGIRL